MVRTHVQFSRKQLERIRAIARRQGISIAEVVRSAVDRYSEQKAPDAAEAALRARALAVTGRYGSGHSDTSADHDRHLARAYRAGGDST